MNNPISNCWYKCCTLGIHKIEQATKSILNAGGFSGNHTNTSLRRMSKSRLIEVGVLTAISKSIVGHTSNADQVYVSKNISKRYWVVAEKMVFLKIYTFQINT